MATSRIIDLNILPSDEENPMDELSENHEFLRNNFDLNVDINFCGELSSQASGEFSDYLDTNFDGGAHVNREIQPHFDLNTSPLNEESGDEEVQENISDGEIRPRKKNLSNAERRSIYDALLERSVDGKLKRDTTKTVASLFNVPIRTVQRIWKQAKYNFVEGVVDVSHKRTKNCGRKRIQIDVERIRGTSLHERTTFRSMACATRYSKSSLHRFYKAGSVRRHSNSIKPYLKEDNKKARLQFCLSMLDTSTLPHDPMFIDMYNIIHIDEKWFFMTKNSERYILLPDEEEPLRTCKSKNFIAKVMFLAAIARPRFDSQGNELFSGKIGIFPFITTEPAKRSSVNRVAGTLETKPINSVGKNMVRTFLIEKILPAIRAKWPIDDLKNPIIIQQDNAKTHVSPDDEEFRIAASQDGFDIRLMYQPANSPDMNVLDLGFFRAIQSLQYQIPSKTIDELIGAVERSFETFSTTKSNYIFLSLQQCMIETMKVQGSNKYKLPHSKKETLEREGRLPV